MSVTSHERPGVYSTYTASSVINGRSGGKAVGLAALHTGSTGGEVVRLTRWEEAAEAFGAEDEISELVRLLLLNGASSVAAAPVPDGDGYGDAFAALEKEEDVKVVVCDSADLTVQQALRDSVAAASKARRERIAVVGGGPEETVSQLTQRAAGLNSERVVLTAPALEGGSGARVAAAVAGAIAGESDPALPLGGAELLGLGALELLYSDSEVDLLVQGGVTPVETVAGQTSVIRGATTRTKTGEAADATWRELTTILIVDEVIPGIRDSLRSRFTRSKNTAQTREAIRSQVVLELEDRLRREIITGYEGVTAQALEEDPTVCLVEFAFSVAHGLSQIWLSAHITV